MSRWQELRNHVVTQIAQTFIISFLTLSFRARVALHQPFADSILDLPRLTSKYHHPTTRLSSGKVPVGPGYAQARFDRDDEKWEGSYG